MHLIISLSIFFVSNLPIVEIDAILYHKDSETRQSISLDGIWQFGFSHPDRGLQEKWHEKRLGTIQNLTIYSMPVPSSYNDIGPNATLRDHVGAVWYEKSFFVPKTWETQNVWVRFSSVCHNASVWINGAAAISHNIGHLPFEKEVTQLLDFGRKNFITVRVDNTLTLESIPQGHTETLISGRVVQTYTFDFFNYAGIDRPVILYTTPKVYIADITVTTIEILDSQAVVSYNIIVGGAIETLKTRVTIIDARGQDVTQGADYLSGTFLVPNPKLWWPYLMDPNPGYLYKLKVELIAESTGALLDIYKQPFGIRKLSWNSTSFLINGRPIYLRGFGKHEDSDFRGKGLDIPIILRDLNLIKWTGANSFRTSNYPYSEEIMDLADQMGIMVIEESPAANVEFFSEELLENHKKSITEMMQRDKNRPSVVMWSAGNDPRTQYLESLDYFREVMKHIKKLDSTRPVTISNSQNPNLDYGAKLVDIISVNLYQGWFLNGGYLDVIVPNVLRTIRNFHDNYQVPILMSEYGADSVEGLELLPTYIWTEEYQVELLSQHFQAFDMLRHDGGYFIGEIVWNFADFKTAQDITKVGGNKKGVFTRNRQPKSSAHFLRKRYWSLAQSLDHVRLPDDLYKYIYEDLNMHRDEL